MEYIIKINDNDVVDADGGKRVEEMHELVRCKDCRKRYTPMCQLYFGCPKQKDSFFCADGERK